MIFLTAEHSAYLKLLSEAPSHPKRLKVTEKFYNYLKVNLANEIICDQTNNLEGYFSYFTGIPVEIDDTIENEHYKWVY